MDHAYTQLASRTTQGAAAVRVTVDGVYGNQRLDKREKRVNGQVPEGEGGCLQGALVLLTYVSGGYRKLYNRDLRI
jgi:hypothetical protein